MSKTKNYKKKNFCVITSSRADYGILSNFLKKLTIKHNTKIIATGTHLSKKYGYTINQIKKDKIKIFKKLKILPRNDSENSIASSIGISIKKYSDLFKNTKIDLLILLGDRYEIFAAAIAASIHRIKIAHIHGGETTSNALDESFRHSITIMSQIHFVSAKKYYKRVIQLGKNPRNVHLVGALSISNIKNFNFNQNKSFKKLFKLDKKKINIVFIYHPETLEKNYGLEGLKNTLAVLKKMKNVNIYASLNNADTKSKIFTKVLEKFDRENDNFYLYKSIDYKNFITLLKNSDLILGNSSSGIIEAPSLEIATVNIGLRQDGRIRANSVFDSTNKKKDIKIKIKKALNFNTKNLVNPYEQKNSIEKIIKYLEIGAEKDLIGSKFFDIKNVKI